MTRTLTLPVDSNGYGADTRPPAPEWLIEATPGAPELAEALKEAQDAARTVEAQSREATIAFRAASQIDRENEWAPRPGVEYDRWRALRSQMDGFRGPVQHEAPRRVRVAWHALRDLIAASDEASDVAHAVAQERYDEAKAAAAHLVTLVSKWAEAAKLTGETGSEFGLLNRAAREYFEPVDDRPWRFIRTDKVAA